MKPLPMPLRLAAGLVATAIEEAHELPRKLIELPVTAVSQALQATMRVQQRLTELAIRGDRALGALRPVPETPAWARFDEDEEDLTFSGPTNGLATGGWAAAPPAPRRTVSPIPITRDIGGGARFDANEPFEDAEDHEGADEGPDEGPDANGAHAVFDEDEVDAPDEELDAAPLAAEEPADSATPAGADAPPDGLEEYDSWTLPQLRGRFRSLSLEQVRALLEWETSHQDRPPYVTMLSNRVASITGR